MQKIPTGPRSATDLVRRVLAGFSIEGVTEVHSRRSPNGLQTIVFLDSAADGDTVLTYLTGAFGDIKVAGHLGSNFISLAFRSMNITAAEELAYEVKRADDNAARYYHAASTGDLHRWLSPTYSDVTWVDAWTKGRRISQMQRELAVRHAELCTDIRHDVFEDERGEDVASHVAEHLRKLRGL
jgi:hypothetical protein